MQDQGEYKVEISELRTYEAIIEKGFETFVDVGLALLSIRDKRLYKNEYPTFEKYCKERWGMVSRQANRLIVAAEITETLRPIGLIPSNEAQARPLASVPAGEQMQVWQQVIDTAPLGLVTAAHVQEVVEEYKGNGKPHVANNTGENEWYTPPEYIAAARRVMGRIDLDPASSDKANEIVKASMYHTKQDDGLSKFWAGRVWMNPPYASNLIGKFISKFTDHVKNGDISEGIVLVNNATETNWFNQLISVSCAVVFPTKRIKFIDTEGDASGTPLQGQAIVYIGSNPDKFIQEFGIFGWSAKTC